MTGAGARAGTDGASLRFNADHAQAAGGAGALHGALMGGRCRRWRGPASGGWFACGGDRGNDPAIAPSELKRA